MFHWLNEIIIKKRPFIFSVTSVFVVFLISSFVVTQKLWILRKVDPSYCEDMLVFLNKNTNSKDMLIKNYDLMISKFDFCLHDGDSHKVQSIVSLLDQLKKTDGFSIFLDRLELHFESMNRASQLVVAEQLFGVMHWDKRHFRLKDKFKLSLLSAISKYSIKRFEHLHIMAVLDSSGKN